VEWHKQRLRVITHSFDANQQQFPHLQLPSLDEVRFSIHEGEHTICFDMASFFSQFPLTEEVRNFMCFKRNGKLYRWCRLPMGHRPACHIAQAALDRLCRRAASFAHTCKFVDNVKFTGTKAAITKAALAFLEDCYKVHGTVNELVDDGITDWMSLSEAEQLEYVTRQITTTTTFLGLDFDHVKKTVRVATKTLEKLERIWNLRWHWSLHDFSAYISLCCYVHYAMDIPLAPEFDVLGVNRMISQYGALSTHKTFLKEYWALPMPKEWLTGMHGQLEPWVYRLASIVPMVVPTPQSMPFDALFVKDGSGLGGGIIGCFADEDWKILHTAAFPWPEHIPHSTSSEPRCTSEIVRFFGRKRFKRALIVSDHTPEIGAINRRRGKSLENNSMVLSLLKYFPNTVFKALHIPGFVMPADSISRGEQLLDGTTPMKVLEKLIKEVKTGRTAFSAASVRPLSDDYFITVLDNSNKLPKAEQMRAVEEFFSNEVLVVGIQPPPSTY
jgi:hypothetical protein